MPPLRGWTGRISRRSFHRKVRLPVATQSLQAGVKSSFYEDGAAVVIFNDHRSPKVI
jgi:hypothetical protein